MHRKYRNKQRDNMKKKLHALYLDKIIQYSSCMKRFAYDWSRWQILNMAFKFLFILFMVASFGMALWMCGVSPLFLFFNAFGFLLCIVCFFFLLFYFGVGWVILLRIFMAFSQQNCFGFTWSYGGNTCVLTAQHTVLFIEWNGFISPIEMKNDSDILKENIVFVSGFHLLLSSIVHFAIYFSP